MLLFEFLETNLINLIVQSVLSLFLFLMLSRFGFLFNTNKKQPMTNLLLSVCVLGAALTVLAAFAPLVISTVIHTVYIVSLFLILFDFYKRDFGFVKGLCSVGIVAYFCISLVLVSSYLFTIQSANVESGILFNGHQNYFSAIPLEFFQADYFGRLRVFDNYPFEWSKYHFFNGSVNSVAMATFKEKNLVTFNLSKLMILGLFLSALVELVWVKLKAIQFFAVIFVLWLATQAYSQQVWWSIFTNNYSSILLFMLVIISLIKNRSDLFLLFLSSYSLSTARSLMPAFSVFSVWCFTNGYFSTRTAFFQFWNSLSVRVRTFASIHIFGLVTMIISGAKTETTFRGKNIFESLKNDGWYEILSPAFHAFQHTHLENAFHPSPISFILLTVFVFILSYRRLDFSFQKVKSKLQSQDSCFKRTFLFICFVLLVFMFCNGNAFLTYSVLLLNLYFSIPNNLSQNVKSILLSFVFVSLLQLLLFVGQFSVPHFVTIEWLTVLFISMQVISAMETSKIATIIVVISAVVLQVLLICNLHFPLRLSGISQMNLRDENTIILPFKSGNPTSSYYKNLSNLCEIKDVKILALASVAGVRSQFEDNKTFNTSVSKAFLGKKKVEHCSQ